MITFNNVTLVPKHLSEKKHRAEDCDASISFCGLILEIPLISSPMPDVTGGLMAQRLAELRCLGIIHRFQPIEDQLNDFRSVKWAPKRRVACAVGITGDYISRFIQLYEAGCRIFCLDTANGFNIGVREAFQAIRNEKPTDNFIIAGNVATVEGYMFLNDLGVDAIRVGIAGGSVCETKTETGVYVPTLESIYQIAEYRKSCSASTAAIIADGGIREPSHMCKAIACGADAVMCGSVLASTEESPARRVDIDGKLFKLYRGAASYSVQQENGRKPTHVEGRETLLLYTGEVEDTIIRYREGIQCSMSYMNAGNLWEYRSNVSVEKL